MENLTFNDMDQAIQEAEATLRRAESYTQKMGKFISNNGRIRQLSSYTLDSLKKQLRNWDMNRKEWKQWVLWLKRSYSFVFPIKAIDLFTTIAALDEKECSGYMSDTRSQVYNFLRLKTKKMRKHYAIT